jgi:RNA polymerase sigma-70 factor, ECF subfamily
MIASFDMRAVFRAEYSYVRRSLERLGVRARDADDLCQEVFLRVHEKRDEYDPARALRPWLFAFAFRVASNYRRLARHRVERAIGVEPEGAAPDPEAATAAAEEKRLLLEALDTLDLDRRAVVVMHDLDGHNAPTIAAALELPLNTVYTRIREGRKDLLAAVRRRTGGPR